MVSRVDLYGGANLRAIPYMNGHHIKQDAVEVEEDTAAQVDVVPIVTEEGWANDGLLANRAQQTAEQRGTFLWVTAAIQQRELRSGMAPLCYKLSIVCV